MAYDLWLSGYLGKRGTYKFKIIDLVEYFIGACYSYKYTKAFNIKY